MLTKIGFTNFKCFHEYVFHLNRVNIFTGYNGRGKSSVLQAILMLSQSIKRDSPNSLTKLHLNGNFVKLGDFYEIQNDDHQDTVLFNLEMTIQGNTHSLDFGYQLSNFDFKVGEMSRCIIDDINYFETVGKIQESDTSSSNKEISRLFPSFINNTLESHSIHYVSASRIGPINFVERTEVPDFHSVGKTGSFTINTLDTYKDYVSSSMNIDKSDNTNHSLEEATTMWLDFIMSGGGMKVQGTSLKNDKQNLNKILSLDFNFDKLGDKLFHSYNVGFGYSYVLSIIVTALIAKEGNIVIIENPEAHLHPKAQLNLTYLLAKLAARGVQIFIETHSEHVVNGFRLSVLKEEYDIGSNDLNIFFFDSDFNIEALEIKSNGRIPNWPKGFFDQYQMELAEILMLAAKHK